MSVKDVAQEYFSKLNPIAARMCADMDETKAAYDNLWATLSEDEKDQILTESIMKPEILLQYDVAKDRSDLPGHYGAKIVVDDHCSYHDEHSAPFSFRTKSQRDLTIFRTEKTLKHKTPLIITKTENSIQPIVPAVLLSKKETSYGSSNSIPRTGLDLLDNW